MRAPIFGASIHLPDTGGGGEGGDQSTSTDWSFNAAYMTGVSFEAPRWFAEFNAQWAALSGHQDAPFGSVDSNTYFFLARGGVRVVKRLSATVGVRGVRGVPGLVGAEEVARAEVRDPHGCRGPLASEFHHMGPHSLNAAFGLPEVRAVSSNKPLRSCRSNATTSSSVSAYSA